MLCPRKFLRASDDIHHWFTGRNNISFVQNLGFIVLTQNSKGNGFHFQINECCLHNNTFLGGFARKVRYGIPELSRNFGNSLDKTF
ncbi:hypothetical protein AVEN_32443-1 [Araneus ventricosus]|uniref:Uncharacterized protein n=1 Tax=Araneus ventricosus TaxID=182803 RepID=A0A4Y2NT48_ARAVE|nr:hypothetical protein AVEN_32443-1 [Araneus ventricosus]